MSYREKSTEGLKIGFLSIYQFVIRICIWNIKNSTKKEKNDPSCTFLIGAYKINNDIILTIH